MAAVTLTLDVAGERQVKRTFERLGEGFEDFRPLWTDVEAIIYAAVVKQFKTQGGAGATGKWPALEPEYERRKLGISASRKAKDRPSAKQRKTRVRMANAFSGMQILVRTGNLRASATTPNGPYSIHQVDPQFLKIGIAHKMARAHQLGHIKRNDGVKPQRRIYDFLQDDGELTRAFNNKIEGAARDFLRGVVKDAADPGVAAGGLQAPTLDGVT